jgi:cytochrome b
MMLEELDRQRASLNDKNNERQHIWVGYMIVNPLVVRSVFLGPLIST